MAAANKQDVVAECCGYSVFREGWTSSKGCSMKPLCCTPHCLPYRDEESGLRSCPQAASTTVTPSEPPASLHEGWEVCTGLELFQILLLETLPSYKITLTLGNNRLHETHVRNSPVLLVFQKPRTRAMTRYNKNLHVKLFWQQNIK